MARNVTDAAILLDVIDGANQNYADALDPGGLQGARIGVWTSATGDSSPEVDALFQETIARLQQLGATTVEVEAPPQNRLNANEFPALLTEFAHDINAYLAATPGPHPNNLAQLSIDSTLARFQPRRDRRADEQPGLADHAGRR